jgi:3-deoxy-D-manno-octulosonate 8-phosphate phosphatase KdsC-like HAD superfamily phosphatase
MDLFIVCIYQRIFTDSILADLQVDPQEAAQVAADLQDVHAVLKTCGMSA